MIKNRVQRRSVTIVLALALISLPPSLVFAQPGSPRIVWSPGPLVVEVAAGTAQPFGLTLNVTGGSLADGTLTQSPAIGRFMTLASSALPAIDSGQQLQIGGLVSVPASTAPGRYDGTLHVRRGQRTVPDVLAVQIRVVSPTAEHIPVGATLPSADRLSTLDSGRPYVHDELVVILKPDTADPSARIQAIASQMNASILGSVAQTFTYQLRFNVNSLPALTGLVAQIEALPDVESANLSTIVVTSQVPNDTSYTDLWSEPNPAGDNWNLEMIKAPSAWNITTGSPTVPVAILDADLDAGHRDLANNVTSSLGATTDQAAGHGTHVAGIACAEGNNARGVAGVAWACNLRLYDSFGGTWWKMICFEFLLCDPNTGSDGYAVTTVFMQEWMIRAASDGARVVNMSVGYGLNVCPSTVTDPDRLTLAAVSNTLGAAIAVTRREGRDVLWVFAAGNGCRDVQDESPASLVARYPENTIAVAAVGIDGRLASYSNFGTLITVAAPGGDGGQPILSTLPRLCPLPLAICPDQYGHRSGTSQAAPHVTGLAALILAQHPTFAAAQVRDCLVTTSTLYGARVFSHPVPAPGLPPPTPFHIISAPEAVNCSRRVTLLPGQEMQLRFRTHPPFVVGGDTLAPNVLSFRLIGVLNPIVAQGNPTYSVKLFDGAAQLASSSGVVNCCVLVDFRSSSTPFASILNGTIEGMLTLSINQGSLTFDLGEPLKPADLRGDVIWSLFAPHPTIPSNSLGSSAWLEITSLAIRQK